MTKRLVTKLLKNDFFGAMKRAGLNPVDFYWEEQPSEGIPNLIVSAIVHNSKEYFFVFDYCSNTRTPCFVHMSPGRDYSPQKLYLRGSNEYLTIFPEWLKLLKYELNTPDLWYELLQHRKLALTSTDIENIPFTLEEQAHLSTKLDELKLLITQSVNTQHLSKKANQEQIQAIEIQLKYIKSALGRIGRIDWKNLAIGALMGLITNIAIMPECRPTILKALEYIVEYVVAGRITYLK